MFSANSREHPVFPAVSYVFVGEELAPPARFLCLPLGEGGSEQRELTDEGSLFSLIRLASLDSFPQGKPIGALGARGSATLAERRRISILDYWRNKKGRVFALSFFI